jgi:hypothetical protein
MDMWPRWPYPWAVGSKNVQRTEFIRGLELMQSAFHMLLYDCGAEKRIVGYWKYAFPRLFMKKGILLTALPMSVPKRRFGLFKSLNI